MKLVGYARVSTDEQASTGVSPEAQKERLALQSKILGHDLIRVEYDPGISGREIRRPGLQRVIKALETGEAEGLIVTKLDRLTRSLLHFCRLVESHFKKPAPYRLLSCAEPVDLDTPSGRMMAYLLVLFAQFEVEITVERTQTSMSHKRLKGQRLGTIPFGFSLDPSSSDSEGKPCDLIPNLTEMETLKLILQMKNQGISNREIAETLNESKIPSRSPRKNGPSRWHHSTIAQILKRTPILTDADQSLLPPTKETA